MRKCTYNLIISCLNKVERHQKNTFKMRRISRNDTLSPTGDFFVLNYTDFKEGEIVCIKKYVTLQYGLVDRKKKQ